MSFVKKYFLTVFIAFVAGMASYLLFRDGASGTGTLKKQGATVEGDRAEAVEFHVSSSASRLSLERAATSNAVGSTDEAVKLESRSESDLIDGEYVLSFYNDYDQAQFLKLAKERGIKIVGSMPFAHAVKIRASREEYKNLMDYAPKPVDASKNYYVRIPERGDERPLAEEPGYIGFGNNALGWLGVRENQAWGKGVTVAVLDTGVGLHKSLSGVKITRVDLVGGEILEGSEYNHGTAMASIIAGRGEGVIGVAPAVDLLSIRVMDNAGKGDSFLLAQGIVEAVDRGAKVVNMSLGSSGDSYVLREAVKYAQSKGVVLVASSGNDAEMGVLYPAGYDGVVAVGAVDGASRHLYFSNRGESLDLMAPGVGVNAAAGDENTAMSSGTSVAASFVSGASAMLMSEDPSLASDKVLELLRSYSNDSGAPGKDDFFGYGVLDIGRLETKDTPGIYDAAVCNPYVPPGRDGSVVVVSVQNRGTEGLGSVFLDVEIDGVSSTVGFYNVGVGVTESHEFLVDRTKFQRGETVDLKARVRVGDVQDVDARNDVKQSILLVVP